jgi:hypothetical protein
MALISKNNVGAAVLLLFVVVLSQARVFDVLMNTALGRILLIAFILFLSYANKILGVVGVLFIIIMFNSSSSFSLEGFEAEKDGAAKDGTLKDTEAAAAVAANSSDAMKKPVVVEKKKAAAVAAEGFDILGTENNIRRGKQSNSIPVRKENNMDNDVFAYDSSSIFGSFSPW